MSQLELAGKRVEFIREIFPNAQRIGVLWDAASREQAVAAAKVSETLGFEPHLLELTGEPPDYVAALLPMQEYPTQPIVISASPLFLRDRATITRLLIQRSTPSICAFREVMEAGALTSYGINLVDVFRDVAYFVDQVAKAPKQATFQCESRRIFTSRSILKQRNPSASIFRRHLLARADEVIE